MKLIKNRGTTSSRDEMRHGDIRATARNAAAAIVAVLLLPLLLGYASAQESDQVSNIEVVKESPNGKSSSTLLLSLDQPVSRREAVEIRQRLAQTTQPRSAQEQVETLGCQQHLDRSDENGSLTLQFQCFPDYGVANWGFRLSLQVQAIVVGSVSEDGLRWWRNSAEQPRNAPHVVPADYLFHGTMKPTFVNETIDYQDLFTFRHNIGPGGTGKVTFAGSLALTP